MKNREDVIEHNSEWSKIVMLKLQTNVALNLEMQKKIIFNLNPDFRDFIIAV